MNQLIINKYQPLSEAGLYMLVSLFEERHGYGISKYVSSLTNGRVTIGAGTLYGNLSKMEKDKLTTFMREEDNRKVYLITDLGKTIVELEFQRIKVLNQLVNQFRNKKDI